VIKAIDATRARLAVCLAVLGLSGCTQSTLRMAPEFGAAVRQDEAAQIADPDARYTGTPAPGSKGQRVGLAQKRYDTNQVVQPLDIGASNAGAINNSNSSSNAGGNANGASGGPGGP
jgi:hypothetical protein